VFTYGGNIEPYGSHFLNGLEFELIPRPHRCVALILVGISKPNIGSSAEFDGFFGRDWPWQEKNYNGENSYDEEVAEWDSEVWHMDY